MADPYDLRYDSGRLCLDLLATVGSRPTDAPIERLSSDDLLTSWLAGTGLVPAQQQVAVGPDWLERFHRARALIHRVVHTVLSGQPVGAADRASLNDMAGAATAVPRLNGSTARTLDEPLDCAMFLAAVARDAIEVLSGPDRLALHVCEGSTCDLVFVDASRGRRRRWCSSASCGNRDRVLRHRERARGV